MDAQGALEIDMVERNGYAGKWEVLEATLPNGQPGYTGTIAIRPQGRAFDLVWEISAGAYVGIGLPLGERLLVSCGPQRAGLGLALFRGADGSAVTAEWTVPELAGAVGGGAWLSPWTGSFEGSHELVQQLPDGTAHGEWTLEIRQKSEVFEIDWIAGGAVHFRGLGIVVEGVLAAGFYPDLGQLALLDYVPSPQGPDQLEGRWALGGFTSLATERLRRIG